MVTSQRKHRIVFPPNIDREKFLKSYAVGFASIYIARTLQRFGLEKIAGMGVAAQQEKKALNDALAFTRSLQAEMSLYMTEEEKVAYNRKADAIWSFCQHIEHADAEKLDYFIQILSDAVNADVVLACSTEEYEHLLGMNREENPTPPTRAQWDFMRRELEKPGESLRVRLNELEARFYGAKEPEPTPIRWEFSKGEVSAIITPTLAGFGLFIAGKNGGTFGPYDTLARAKGIFANKTKIKSAKWESIHA